MRSKILIIIYLFGMLLPSRSGGQIPDTFTFVEILPVSARFATADNLGNTYIISQTQAIEKYAPGGKLLARYTNNRLGVPGYLDVSNPLKVLVWYPDFRTIVFLDRNGTELGKLDLIQTGFPDVRVVATARDGNLWLYDEAAFRVRKTSPEGKILLESQDLSLLGLRRLNITCMREDGNRLYVSNKNEDLITLDAYAQLWSIQAVKGIGDFEISGNELFYIDGFSLQQEDIQVFTNAERPLPADAKKSGNQCRLGPGRIFIQEGNDLKIFRF